MRKTILLLALVTIATSLSAQIIEDNRERTTISYVKSSFGSFATLRTIEDTYFITYKDARYESIISLENFTIGDKDDYNAFRKIILECFSEDKKGARKRFSLNDKKFRIITYTKKMIGITITDGGIAYDMGFWKVKKMNKLLPKLD